MLKLKDLDLYDQYIILKVSMRRTRWKHRQNFFLRRAETMLSTPESRQVKTAEGLIR